jgi:predicted RNase H-like HicB family nuclease
MELQIEVFKEKEGSYIATCPKLEIYSYGETPDIAIDRLKKVVNFYMESAEELGVTIEDLCLSSGKNLMIQDFKEIKSKTYN